jgi:hypothetical protein
VTFYTETVAHHRANPATPSPIFRQPHPFLTGFARRHQTHIQFSRSIRRQFATFSTVLRPLDNYTGYSANPKSAFALLYKRLKIGYFGLNTAIMN